MWTAPNEKRPTRPIPIMKDIEFAADTEVWVVGDVHGRLGSLRKIHHDWVQADKAPYIVGLGDMIDRGNRQLEVLAGMIAWRALYPHKVSFVRGNHETIDMAMQYGFGCAQMAEDTIRAFMSLFQEFPASLRLRQPTEKANAVVMHGGFGPRVLAQLFMDEGSLKQSDTMDEQDLNEILWSEGGEYCSPGKGGLNCTLFTGEAMDAVPKQWAEAEPGSAAITSMFQDSSRGLGHYRTNTATRFFMRYMRSCLLLTGHSHRTTIQSISQHPDDDSGRCGALHGEGGEAAGYTQAVTLSAHNFWAYSNLPADDPRNVGLVGVLSVEDHQVRFRHRPVFTAREYDAVSEMLDVGVCAGGYPEPPCKNFLRPRRDGEPGYECMFGDFPCPERYEGF